MDDFEDRLRGQVQRADQQRDDEQTQLAEIVAGIPRYRPVWAKQARTFAKVAAESGMPPSQRVTERTTKKRFGRTAVEKIVHEYYLDGGSIAVTTAGELVEPGRPNRLFLDPDGLSAELIHPRVRRKSPSKPWEPVVQLRDGETIVCGISPTGELMSFHDPGGWSDSGDYYQPYTELMEETIERFLRSRN